LTPPVVVSAHVWYAPTLIAEIVGVAAEEAPTPTANRLAATTLTVTAIGADDRTNRRRPSGCPDRAVGAESWRNNEFRPWSMGAVSADGESGLKAAAEAPGRRPSGGVATVARVTLDGAMMRHLAHSLDDR
jgi:hypothetical protein